MSRDEFIKLCIENGNEFKEANKCDGWSADYDGVYVYGKPYTQENGNKYTPYLRVSNFSNNSQYVRDNGYCCNRNDNWIKKELLSYVY